MYIFPHMCTGLILILPAHSESAYDALSKAYIEVHLHVHMCHKLLQSNPFYHHYQLTVNIHLKRHWESPRVLWVIIYDL